VTLSCKLCSHFPIDTTKTNCYYSIQPHVDVVVSESLATPSSSHVMTPQDTAVDLASPYFLPDDFVHSLLPPSAPVYLGAEPSSSHVPIPFQYDLDFNSQALAEDIFSSTYYDPSCHFIPPSTSTQAGRLNMEPYQQWLPVDPNSHIFPRPQPIPSLSYDFNASSSFPGNSDNDIFADIAGSSASNDGTGTTLPFPTSSYDANSYYL
jgi:hypothetical protein